MLGLEYDKISSVTFILNILQGLAKRLTYEGIDAVAIESFESLDVCGQRGQREGRVILTKGLQRYGRLAKYVKVGDCLALINDLPDAQVQIDDV